MRIAIASGKGGTGKTMISTNLFRALEIEGMDVSVVDCDAEEPNVTEFLSGELTDVTPVKTSLPSVDEKKCIFCGKCHDYCNYHAIVFLPTASYIKVVDELCHDCGACTIACGSYAITLSERQLGMVTSFRSSANGTLTEGRTSIGVYSPVPVIKEAIKKGEGKIVILDSPPGISCPFVATTVRADFVILVTEPTPFGLNDLKLAAETLNTLGKKYGVIINRAGLGNRDVNHWIEANNIPLLMEINFDREIARIYSMGKLIVNEMPGYKEAFVNMYKRILN